MAKIKAYELRSNNKGALLKKLDELKNELGQVSHSTFASQVWPQASGSGVGGVTSLLGPC